MFLLITNYAYNFFYRLPVYNFEVEFLLIALKALLLPQLAFPNLTDQPLVDFPWDSCSLRAAGQAGLAADFEERVRVKSIQSPTHHWPGWRLPSGERQDVAAGRTGQHTRSTTRDWRHLASSDHS